MTKSIYTKTEKPSVKAKDNVNSNGKATLAAKFIYFL